MASTRVPASSVRDIPEPPVARFLFADPRMAWFWLIVRLYAAYEWLAAGLEKLTGTNYAFGSGFGTHDPKTRWVFTSDPGAPIRGVVQFALLKAPGGKLADAHPDVQGWYAAFLRDIVLPHAAVWSYVIAFGETLVGLGLLVGALTGIAAFFGLLMNVNYLFAGTVSINPILAVCCLGLVMAWRIAGWYGLDR